MTIPKDQRRVLLGQINGAHGIRGDVVVRSFTADPADIAAYGALTDHDGKAPLSLSVIRVTDKGVVARVANVSDRTSAEALKGRELYVLRSKLPAANEGEFYHADLIGLDAVSAHGEVIGRIVAVQNFGAGDLLEIRATGSRDSDYIPFTNACVPEVDIAAGRVTIIPPVMTGEPEPPDDGAAGASEHDGD